MTIDEKNAQFKINHNQSSMTHGKKRQPSMGGMTNGLGGHTNGMANSLGGRTNGMTNGLGGRTNGMTNGMGGRTNGMTNGLGSGGPVMRSRRMDDSAISPFRISLIIVIAFMVIVPASFFMLAQNDPAYKGVRVDGDFEDWNEVEKFVDPQQYSIAALDIVNYAIATNTAGTLFLYADTRDSMMSISQVDSLLVFIDADDNPGTGYSVRGMGADYVAEVHGWEGTIKGKQMGVFSGSDQGNWSAWNWRGMNAAMSLTQIEMGIPGSSITLQAAHSFLFMTKRGDSVAEICDARIALGKSALVVRQIPGSLNGVIASDGVMSLELSACGQAVNVTAIDFSYSGVTAPTVSGLPAKVPAGGTITLAVTAPVTGLANGTYVDIAVSLVTGTGLSTILGQRMTAYANAAPGSITIDGAFGDWNGVPKANDLDAAANPDIDIAQYAGVKSPSQAFFYLKVSDGGEMMGGSMVPLARTIPGEPGEPGTPTPPVPLQRVSGEDITRIYIDTKPGGQNINGVSADYLIEIKGMDGHITSRALYSLPGKTFIMNVGAANLGRELEVGVALDQISYNASMIYFIESTDWIGIVDRTDSRISSPMPFATRNGGALERPYSLTPHAPIRINSDADFSGIASAGNGAHATPWIIENWNIDGTGYGYCIYIGNTTEHFAILNCSLNNASGMGVLYYPDAGLAMYNVTNGIAWNNTASGSGIGLYLESSDGNTLANNIASSNGIGIYLLSLSNFNIITNNTVSSNNNDGICLSYSGSNTLSNNTATNNNCGISIGNSVSNTISNNTASSNLNYGIYILQSSTNLFIKNKASSNGLFGFYICFSVGNTLSNNTMVNDGIVIDGNLLEHWNTHTIDSINTVNGKPVYYWKNQTGGTVPLGAGQVILANSKNVIIQYLNVSGGTVGILLGFSSNNTISNITASSNLYRGIYLYSSSNNTISNNTALNNQDGIFLRLSSHNLLTNNTVNSNFVHGLTVEISGNNTIANNTVSLNTIIGLYLFRSDNNNITTNTVSNNHVGIFLFTSNNNILANNTVSANSDGISLSSSNNNTIAGNIANLNINYGIDLTTASSNNILAKNIVSNNVVGIMMDSSINNVLSNNSLSFNSYGIYAYSSTTNTVAYNTITSSYVYGIYFLASSNYNTIFKNNISGNYADGITIDTSSYNNISKNTISLNANYGLYIFASSNNTISGNIFIANGIQAYDDTGANSWNLGYPLGGNYWSDYTGVDNYSGPGQNLTDPDHDHIGDTPYTNIGGGMGAVDQYPLYTIPEFQTILLPIIVLLGLVFMVHSKKSEEEEILAECPSCNTLFPADETKCPTCGEEFSADEDSWDELAELVEGPSKVPAEAADAADEADSTEPAKPEIKHTMLFGGLALSAVGAFGVVGLRAGVVQPILGYANPSPGIGSMEMMGLVASALPLAFGLLIILLWGFRNNPAYYEMEKSRETDVDSEQSEPTEELEMEPVDVEEPEPVKAAPIVKEIPPAKKAPEPAIKTPEPAPVAKKAPEPVAKAPEPARVAAKAPEPVPPAKKTPEPTPVARKAPEPIPSAVKVSEPVPPTKKAPEPTPVVKKAPEAAPAGPISDQDKIRIERCRKMMSFAAVLPEDTERLKALIAAGTPVQKFTEEIKKAVEKRKKIDSEAAEKKKVEDAARKKKEDEEKALLEEIENPKDKDPFDDADLEDLLLTEIDK